MKFIISKVSEPNYTGSVPDKEIEVNSLEELMQIVDREKTDLIINREAIIIYDDYIE